MLANLDRFLTAPIDRSSSRGLKFWLSLSLGFAAIYGILGLKTAFSSQYVIQDDARLHVFWMWRFLDQDLFPNDIIADYFQSFAPWGYATFYRLFTAIGIEPIFLSKLLPIVLGLITTAYCFGTCLKMFPVPAAGFITTLLLNHNLWMKDDLVSATPRAFIYPLFLAFLYYLSRYSLLPCLVVLILEGLFYPSLLFICVGILILGLWSWERGGLHLSQKRRDYLFCALGLGVSFLVLLPYALKSSEWGPVVTVTEARAMPEFWPGGRIPFFTNNPQFFGLCTRYSGILPQEWCWLTDRYSPKYLLMPPQIWAGLLLPILVRFPSRFPLVTQVTKQVKLLPQMLLASLGMFFAAHALLFKLYLPQRYTEHSLRIVMPLAAGIALTIVLDVVFHASGWLAKSRLYRRKFLALATTVLLGTALVFYPGFLKLRHYPFPYTKYVVGQIPKLYEFFAQQSKDTLIASLAREADNLPTFSQRSILVSPEYVSTVFHPQHYARMHQRTIDLINAQYSPELNKVQNFIQKYGVDFWLLERSAFRYEKVAKNLWLRQFQPVASETVARLKQGTTPALLTVMESCSVWENQRLVVLEAKCITNFKQKGQES